MKIAYNPKTAAALTSAPLNNDITFDLPGVAIYAKGIKFKGTDTTYGVVSSTADGLAPKIGTAAASTVTTQADEWVLTSTKGATPTWRKLPTNAFLNYYRPILVNGTSLLGNNNTALNIVAGNNINLTTDSGKVTINNTITKLSLLTDDILSGKYLPLTGGTLTGDLNIGSETTVNTSDRRLYLWKGDGTNSRRGLLILNNQGTSLSYWNVTTKHYSSLWINESGLYFTLDGSANPTLLKIWHERNDGSDSGLDADLLDGKHATDFLPHATASSPQNNDETWINQYAKDHPRSYVYNNSGLEWQYLIGLNSNKSEYGSVLRTSYLNGGTIQIKALISNVWNPWKTVAFTDSNITGNAASADKLKNKVQLWGNDFDGSNNVNGDISLGGKKIYWHVDPEHYYIGTSYTISSQSTNLDYEAAAGHRFLSFNKELLRITTSGYVGVGTTDPKSKLDVNGSISNKDIINCYLDGTVNRLTMRMVDNVGMVYAFNESESGYKKLLIGRNDGTTITIAENGNVGIGTYYPLYKLDVDGVCRITNKLVLNNNVSIVYNDTSNKEVNVLQFTKNNVLHVGYNTNDYGYATYIHGTNIYLNSGELRNTGIILNSLGNVTIGNSNLAGSAYKLYVNGNTNINGSLTASTFLGNLDWSYITNKPTSFTPAAHDHTRIVNTDTSGRGIEGTLVPSKFEKGLTFNTIYGGTAKSWPVNYGNVVTIRGNGDNLIVISWNANQTETNTNVALEMYIRSKRDSGAGDQWSDWTRVITDRNYSEYCAPKTHTHTSNQITTLTGYTKATSASDLVTTDTLNIALGKLEYKAGIAYSWYRTITEDDTDTIINKWDEVVDFVNNLEVDLTEEFVTRKTNQTITGLKTFSKNIIIHDSTGADASITFVRGTIEPDSMYDFKIGVFKGLNDQYTNFGIGLGNRLGEFNRFLYTETDGAYNVVNLISKVHVTAPGATINGRVLINVGEGLRVHGDDNYFGTNADARIISLLDSNGTFCDGGLIIDERTTYEGNEYITELLRIRHDEFKWKGATILHSGNSHIKNGVITINGNTITPLTSHQSLANYVTLNTALTISGVKTFSTLLKFTVSLGTSPFTVTSNTKVDNLNADFLDDYHVTSLVRKSEMANNSSFNANNMTTDLVIYTSKGDVGSNASVWDNFGASKPAGGFSLFHIKEGGYARQLLGVYGDRHLYTRSQYYSSGTVWSSWSTIALTSDIPKVTDYYWANVKISSTSSTTTTPTFGALTLTTPSGIAFKGSKATNTMIKFLDNTVDSYGNGIVIGGGGVVIIGSGESSSAILSDATGGTENTYITSDGDILFCSGMDTSTGRKNMVFGNSGNLTVPGTVISNSGFNKTGSSNSYVLLGGGGHKALSDFLLESELATQELSANLTTITKSLTVTADWMDTGIDGDDFVTGTYIVLVSCAANTGSFYDCYWSGVMSWWKGRTNDTDADEIILHRSGRQYTNTIYLRTIMRSNTDTNGLKLLIAADKNLGAAYTYTFKFKRII